MGFKKTLSTSSIGMFSGNSTNEMWMSTSDVKPSNSKDVFSVFCLDNPAPCPWSLPFLSTGAWELMLFQLLQYFHAFSCIFMYFPSIFVRTLNPNFNWPGPSAPWQTLAVPFQNFFRDISGSTMVLNWEFCMVLFHSCV